MGRPPNRERAVVLMRDRLIELINDMQDKGFVSAKGEDEISCHVSNKSIADYLLKNGVIVPPCKVGQTVYKISYRKGSNVKYVEETTICRIAIDNEGIWLFCSCNPIVKCKFGKLVFLTKEEAEQALQKVGVEDA